MQKCDFSFLQSIGNVLFKAVVQLTLKIIFHLKNNNNIMGVHERILTLLAFSRSYSDIEKALLARS